MSNTGNSTLPAGIQNLIDIHKNDIQNVFIDLELDNNMLLKDENDHDLTVSVTTVDGADVITLYVGGTSYLVNSNYSDLDAASLNTIIANYNAIVGSYTGIVDAYDKTFENQNTVYNIITTEKERLEKKKELVDTSMFEQKRAQSLNESYRQKYKYYIHIIVAFILLLVSFIVLNKISNVLTFIPDVVYDLLYVASITIVGFYIYFKLRDISRRDHMDFSKINTNPPKQLTPEELEQQRSANYNGGVNLTPQFCVGADCCNPDGVDNATIWNTELGQCVYAPAEPPNQGE
jgi:hypothetical protein